VEIVAIRSIQEWRFAEVTRAITIVMVRSGALDTAQARLQTTSNSFLGC